MTGMRHALVCLAAALHLGRTNAQHTTISRVLSKQLAPEMCSNESCDTSVCECIGKIGEDASCAVEINSVCKADGFRHCVPENQLSYVEALFCPYTECIAGDDESPESCSCKVLESLCSLFAETTDNCDVFAECCGLQDDASKNQCVQVMMTTKTQTTSATDSTIVSTTSAFGTDAGLAGTTESNMTVTTFTTPASTTINDTPTDQTSPEPSESPSAKPTTAEPTAAPSTSDPSRSPSVKPTTSPSTVSLTASPTKQPTVHPSASPSSKPSRKPSPFPTTKPTKQPSLSPSATPLGSNALLPLDSSLPPSFLSTTFESSKPTGESTSMMSNLQKEAKEPPNLRQISVAMFTLASVFVLLTLFLMKYKSGRRLSVTHSSEDAEGSIIVTPIHSRAFSVDRKTEERVSKASSSSYQYSLENGIVSPRFHSRGSTTFSSDDRKNSEIVSKESSSSDQYSLEDGIVSPRSHARVCLSPLQSSSRVSGKKDSFVNEDQMALTVYDFMDSKPKRVRRDVFAPTGKVGIIVDTSINGPIVHSLKGDSPLLGKVFIGDVIVAVDDEDTSGWSAHHLTKLVARKNGSVRKLTLLSNNFEPSLPRMGLAGPR